MDTGCGYNDSKVMFFSSDEKKWINRIHKLAAEYPEEVFIECEPEENNGCIYARLPAEYLKIAPKRRCEMSDEQRAVLSERLRLMRKTKGNMGEENKDDSEEERE